jgi:hypothetical protein
LDRQPPRRGIDLVINISNKPYQYEALTIGQTAPQERYRSSD